MLDQKTVVSSLPWQGTCEIILQKKKHTFWRCCIFFPGNLSALASVFAAVEVLLIFLLVRFLVAVAYELLRCRYCSGCWKFRRFLFCTKKIRCYLGMDAVGCCKRTQKKKLNFAAECNSHPMVSEPVPPGFSACATNN